MEKNMKVNFEYLSKRLEDALCNTDTEYIRMELSCINKPTIFSGVGGSSIVSEMGSKILRVKNGIITSNFEPRSFIYDELFGYSNVISCSYSGNNYGVDLSFKNNLKKYLLSNNSFNNPEITYLTYDTKIDSERSFISIGGSLIPISILMNYYFDGNNDFINEVKKVIIHLIYAMFMKYLVD